MTADQFIYWLKGYMAAQIDSQIKADVEKAIKEIETTKHNYVLTRGDSITTSHTSGRLDVTYKDDAPTTKTLITDSRL
jgi:hypothetical protein